jgi:hypothetical protein
VETYSSSPHLFEELDIPVGTKGRLPRDKRTLAGVDAEVLEDLGETGKKNSRGGRDSAPSRERDGRDRTSRGRGGNRDGGRTGGDSAGRAGERRRSTPDSAAAPAAAGDAPAATSTATEGEQPSRARRSRTRTRRRNGEVVAGSDTAVQPGSTEA